MAYKNKDSHLELRVSALEADLAYFAARLALIGNPVTQHQRAQVKTYRALEKSLAGILANLRQSERASRAVQKRRNG